MRFLGVNVFGLILFRACLASFIWDFIQFAIVRSSPPLFLQIPFHPLSWDYDTNDDYFGISVAQSRIIVDYLLSYLLKCWSISWFLHCCYRNFQYNFYLVLFYKCYCFTILLLPRDANLGHFWQFFSSKYLSLFSFGDSNHKDTLVLNCPTVQWCLDDFYKFFTLLFILDGLHCCVFKFTNPEFHYWQGNFLMSLSTYSDKCFICGLGSRYCFFSFITVLIFCIFYGTDFLVGRYCECYHVAW